MLLSSCRCHAPCECHNLFHTGAGARPVLFGGLRLLCVFGRQGRCCGKHGGLARRVSLSPANFSVLGFGVLFGHATALSSLRELRSQFCACSEEGTQSVRHRPSLSHRLRTDEVRCLAVPWQLHGQSLSQTKSYVPAASPLSLMCGRSMEVVEQAQSSGDDDHVTT